MSLASYKELIAWQCSMELTKSIYALTKALPAEERFGLSAQARRSAVSIPSNIAEGYGRHNRKEYIQSLYIAYGSSTELETQVILMADLFELDTARSLQLVDSTQKLLTALIKSLATSAKP